MVETLRIKAQVMRAQALAGPDDPLRRKFYESGASAYDEWASQMQSVLETARHVERTAGAIN